MTHSVDYAREVIRDVARTADAYAAALERETSLHSRRGIMKSAAILRLMGTHNAETDKPHTATSAEKVVESDAEYAGFLQECRTSIADRIRQEADLHSAKLIAQLEVNATRLLSVEA